MMSGMAAEIVLIDRDWRRAEGHVNDLRDAEVFLIPLAFLSVIFRTAARLTVSSRVPESMQLGDVALSLPSIVDRHGITRVLPVALSRSERRALKASAEVVMGHIASLSETIPI